MHVGVEEPFRDRLSQERVDQGDREPLRIVPLREQALAVGQLDAVDPVQRQHPAGGPLPIDRGHEIGGLGRHRFGEFARGRTLAAQVEFARGPPGEGLDHEPRAQAARLAAAHHLQMRCGPAVSVDRAREILLDVRDLPSVGGDRAVHLRDRGGADRRVVEAGEQRFDRLA